MKILVCSLKNCVLLSQKYIVAFLCCYLAACASLHSSGDATAGKNALLQKYINLARHDEKEKKWSSAQENWRIADAVSTGNPEVKSGLIRTNELAFEASYELYQQAKKDYQNGRYTEAKKKEAHSI